jgi:hypothetical protein
VSREDALGSTSRDNGQALGRAKRPRPGLRVGGRALLSGVHRACPSRLDPLSGGDRVRGELVQLVRRQVRLVADEVARDPLAGNLVPHERRVQRRWSAWGCPGVLGSGTRVALGAPNGPNLTSFEYG